MTTARWRGMTAMRPVGSVMVVIMGTIQGDEKALRNLKKKATIMVNRKMKERRAKIWKGKRKLNLKSQENKRTKLKVRDRQKQNNDTGLAKRVTFKMSWRAREVDFNDVEANFRSPDMPVQVSVRRWAERLRVKER